MAESSVEPILGSWFIGAVSNAAVWGISCIQTYTFYMRNPGDRLFLRVLIGFLWCMNTCNFCLNIHSSYFFLVTGYGRPASLTVNIWSLWVNPILSGVMEFIIRSMFTRRVYLLSNKNKLLTTVLVILSVFALACVEYLAVTLAMLKDLTKNISQLALILHLSSLTIVELSIAASLCYYFYTAKGPFKRTNSIIHTLMLYSVSTGLIVFFITISVVILGKFPRSGFVHVMAWLITEAYFCCYLFSLNSREGFQRGRTDDLVSIHLSQVAPSTMPVVAGEKKDDVSISQSNYPGSTIAFLAPSETLTPFRDVK